MSSNASKLVLNTVMLTVGLYIVIYMLKQKRTVFLIKDSDSREDRPATDAEVHPHQKLMPWDDQVNDHTAAWRAAKSQGVIDTNVLAAVDAGVALRDIKAALECCSRQRDESCCAWLRKLNITL